MSEPVPAVAYYRMSTDKQEDSIGRQRSQVEPYAARNGYRIVREYVDEGIAGDEEEKRVAFMQMLKDAKRGEFALILCDDKDRFGRFDSITLGYYVKPLRDAGVKLETVAQGRMDWTSFAGRIIDAILQESKKIESQATSRRVLTMMLNLARQGKWLGGPPPYGYDLAPDPILGKRLVPGDPARVEAVRLMFDLCGNRGYTLDAIVEELQRRGITRPNGGRPSGRQGNRAKGCPFWDKTTVRRLLRNRKYVGDMVWNARHEGKYSGYRGGQVHTADQRTPGQANAVDDWVILPDTHEPLIDRDLFERTQARLEENKGRTTPRGGKTAPKEGTLALGGLLVCADCGWRMVGCLWHGRRYYRCARYQSSGRVACYSNAVMGSRVLECVIRKIEAVVADPATVRRFEERVREQEREAGRAAPRQVDGLRKRIAGLTAKIDQGMERMALIEPDLLTEYGAKLREWKEERDRLRSELEAAEAALVPLDVEATVRAARLALGKVRKAIRAGEPAEVRELLGQLVSKVELHFEQKPARQVNRSIFKRGVIYIRPQADPAETSDLLRALGRGRRAHAPCRAPAPASGFPRH